MVTWTWSGMSLGTLIADRWSMQTRWWKSGVVDNDPDSWVVYVILGREDAERLASDGGYPLEDGCSEAARFISGWVACDRGPGRVFHKPPVLVLFKHKVLIYQRRGWDV